jgi:hypothetical protein
MESHTQDSPPLHSTFLHFCIRHQTNCKRVPGLFSIPEILVLPPDKIADAAFVDMQKLHFEYPAKPCIKPWER